MIALASGVALLVFKINILGNRAWPDRLFVSPSGAHIWIEFKQPGEFPTRLQYNRIRQLNKRNTRASWFCDSDSAINYLEENE